MAAGSKGGLSKSTFYRWWREMQMRDTAANRASASVAMDATQAAEFIKMTDDQYRRRGVEPLNPKSQAYLYQHNIPLESLSHVRRIRKSRGMSERELSELTGISIMQLRQIEDLTRTPTSAQSEALANALKISAAELTT